MFKEPRFAGESEKQERKAEQELIKEGGISYSEVVDPETQEKRATINILGVELETYASKEDIDHLKSPENLLLSEADQNMLRTIAEAYKLKQPLLFEGDPGVGKTFLLERFTQLIHGKDAPILSINGTPRTSDLELLGHWAPKGKESDKEKLGDVMSKLVEQEDFLEVRKSLNKKLDEINKKFEKEEITEEEFQNTFGEITTEYEENVKSLTIDIAKTVGVSDDADWEFKKGALLEAYTGRDGKGQILIVDEFNLIPSNYQQIFLQIGGKNGGMSNQINFFGNSGQTQYKRGEDAWIAFAINSPETTPGRGEVVAPMTDRLVWNIIDKESARQKEEALILTIGGEIPGLAGHITEIKPDNLNLPVKDQLDWRKSPDIAKQIGEIALAIHTQFKKMYEQLGDTLEVKGEKRRRTQQLEFSPRNALRFFSYIDNFQVRDPETGQIDFKKTLSNAFNRYYVDRLASGELVAKAQELFDNIVNDSHLGSVRFEDKVMTRGEVLDILTERATLSPEEKEKMEEREKAKKQAEQKQFKGDVEERISSLADNPNISDQIKKKLGIK